MNRKSRKSRKIRKISLVLGIAVAALSVGVPTALAEGRMVGTQEPNGVAFFKANEMSTLSQQNVSPIQSQEIEGAPGPERGAQPPVRAWRVRDHRRLEHVPRRLRARTQQGVRLLPVWHRTGDRAELLQGRCRAGRSAAAVAERHAHLVRQ